MHIYTNSLNLFTNCPCAIIENMEGVGFDRNKVLVLKDQLTPTAQWYNLQVHVYFKHIFSFSFLFFFEGGGEGRDCQKFVGRVKGRYSV